MTASGEAFWAAGASRPSIRLGQGTAHTDGLVRPLRLFGLQQAAPASGANCLQALAGNPAVDLYLPHALRELWHAAGNPAAA